MYSEHMMLDNSFSYYIKTGAKYCVDEVDNSKHALGTTWTNRWCVQCTCSTKGMGCCDT